VRTLFAGELLKQPAVDHQLPEPNTYVADRELVAIRERINRGKRERMMSGRPLGVGKAPVNGRL